MGICSSTIKLNGIIDNQSSYEIIYHVSGSMKQLTDYEEELNLGPKFGVGMDGVQMEGIGYNKKKYGKNQKYHSVARIPKHSFCSVGLNDIEVGCFLSIYATKLNEIGKQVHKKLIFKDICIRTNEDICLRINKDLTLKQLKPNQIKAMKQYFEKQGSMVISTLKETNDIFQSQSQQSMALKANQLILSTEYVRKKFGASSQRYLKFQETGLFDLSIFFYKKITWMQKLICLSFSNMIGHTFSHFNLIIVKLMMVHGTYLVFKHNIIFQISKIYTQVCLIFYMEADNKITTILEGDLERFPSLKMLQLDYSETQGVNPLTEQSKKYLFNFALENPDVLIYCASIDQTKYFDAEEYNQLLKDPKNANGFQQNLEQNSNAGTLNWYMFLSPGVNSTRQEPETIKQSKIKSKKKKTKSSVPQQNL